MPKFSQMYPVVLEKLILSVLLLFSSSGYLGNSTWSNFTILRPLKSDHASCKNLTTIGARVLEKKMFEVV